MLAERIKRMTPSVTIEMEGIVEDLKHRGIDVISLNAGEPDFDTPINIVNACCNAIKEGKTKYVTVSGILSLKQAICYDIEKTTNVHYEPNQIVISTGAKQAINNIVMTICEPGDEVIIPKPCWVSYVEIVKLAGAKAILVNTKDNFQLDLEEIEKAITDKTKAILINTPNNPTGAVYNEASLKKLGDLAVRNNFFIITDEVYGKLVYDNAKHVSIASLSPEIYQRTLLVNGFSKAYSMTGWRIGFSATDKDIARGISSLQGHTTSNSTTFVQWAAIEALKGQQETIETMKKEFSLRRDYLFKRLSSIQGIHCPNADGAFYLLPDISFYFGKVTDKLKIVDSESFSKFLLSEAKVAVVPGSAFEAPNNIRIAYSNSIDNIKKGLDNIEEALKQLH